jgi:hypothetical protein
MSTTARCGGSAATASALFLGRGDNALPRLRDRLELLT